MSDPTLDPLTEFFIEAFADENRVDPYPFYARKAAEGSVFDTGVGVWLAFDYGACRTTLRAPNTSSDESNSTMYQALEEAGELPPTVDADPLLLFMDPPDHTRLRALVARAFTPRTIDRLRARIEAVTDDLLDGLAGAEPGEEVDLIEHLAYPLPLTAICELLGVPYADHDRFRVWSAAMARMIDPNILVSADEQDRAVVARTELESYVGDLLNERRQSPAGDLISELLAARDGDDRLTEPELVALVVLLLVAGHETTVNLIGNGMVALLDRPDQLAAWRDGVVAGDQAVEELLRFDSPVQFSARVALEPLALGDAVVPVGDQVITILAAANRDPEVFGPDAAELDLSRPSANRHLAFGGGIHHCLGAALARTEGEIVISRLLARFPNIRAAGEASIRPTFTLRGRNRLPVVLG